MENIIKLFEQLFTPTQQVALVIITITVMVLLQVFKNIYFGLYPRHSKNKRKAVLWFMAFVIGVACGVAGYRVGQPPQPLWFWMFAGAASGGGAIGVFKIFVEIEWRAIVRNWINKGA